MKKLPITTLLFALGFSKEKIINVQLINILIIKIPKCGQLTLIEDYKRPVKLS